MTLTGEGSSLEQRRGHVERDLIELAEQVDRGEIDPTTATRLEASYRAELAEVETALAGLPETSDAAGTAPVPARRTVVGTVAVLAALTVAIAFIGGDTIPAQQGAAAGIDATPRSAPADAGSLDAMEQALAADPDNISLRLALADVYFRREEFSPALSHYLAVMEAAPTPEQQSIALGRVGWMSFITGQLDAADAYLTRSLAVDPENVEGKLFLGYLLLFGFDDPAGAIPLFEDVLADPTVGDELRIQILDALELARSEVAAS